VAIDLITFQRQEGDHRSSEVCSVFHNQHGAEHILYSLLNPGVAQAQVLNQLGINLPKLTDR
jgi:hypothetical protein